MVAPIITYGNPILRTDCVRIDKNYPGIGETIDCMWETLGRADGCGLAAPQINIPIETLKNTFERIMAKQPESFNMNLIIPGGNCMLIIYLLYENNC